MGKSIQNLIDSQKHRIKKAEEAGNWKAVGEMRKSLKILLDQASKRKSLKIKNA